VAGLLVLWDVDFTLVDTTGVGRRLYELAFAELFGRSLPPNATEAGMAGRTDRAIALDVLERAGLTDPHGQLDRFAAALTRLAPRVVDLAAATGHALPGARAALAAVAGLPGTEITRQSVLTGNIRALAEAKLGPFGLVRYLDLDIGAYGDESEHRADLVYLARDRAVAAYGGDFLGEATVIIGDTPLDVEAALTTGARALGVATGRYTPRELAAAGAHVVLPDLSDTDQVLASIAPDSRQTLARVTEAAD
jgi:phosphoglycolate phosphatase-like HAD superfamily hydrolase